MRNRIGFLQFWATSSGCWNWQKLDYDWLRAFCPRLQIMHKAFEDIWIFCGKTELGYFKSLLTGMEDLANSIKLVDQQRAGRIAAEKAALSVFQPQQAAVPAPSPAQPFSLLSAAPAGSVPTIIPSATPAVPSPMPAAQPTSLALVSSAAAASPQGFQTTHPAAQQKERYDKQWFQDNDAWRLLPSLKSKGLVNLAEQH